MDVGLESVCGSQAAVSKPTSKGVGQSGVQRSVQPSKKYTLDRGVNQTKCEPSAGARHKVLKDVLHHAAISARRATGTEQIDDCARVLMTKGLLHLVRIGR